MSNPARGLLRVELTSLGVMAVCAALFAAFITIVYLSPVGYDKPADETYGHANILAAWFFVVGAVPTSLFGAPAYVALARRGRANWFSVLAVGLVPGLLLLLVDREAGVYGSITGVVVSLTTHAFCRKMF